MQLNQFTYDLPEGRIATEPIEPRHDSKMLASLRAQMITDSNVYDLPDFLNEGDLIIVNNTKVLPARIPITRSTGGKGEIFLLHRIDDGLWNALVKPNAKITDREIVESSNGKFEFQVGQNLGDGHRVVSFLGATGQEVLELAGQTPLPPYLGDVEIPIDRYQTMFAKDDKSVAAPTAGLHFTDELVSKLNAKGIDICEVTLHVGVGTFRPIVVENVEDHVMHEESYFVEEHVWEKIQEVKKRGFRVCAVGTTSLRTIESVALKSELTGSTDLYCYGDFNFQVADYLFTNFHQPHSSLLVLIDSFMGSEWKDLYEHALKNNYRFLSFGDAMLIANKEIRSK